MYMCYTHHAYAAQSFSIECSNINLNKISLKPNIYPVIMQFNIPTGRPFCLLSSSVSKNVSCCSQCLSHAAHRKLESNNPHPHPAHRKEIIGGSKQIYHLYKLIADKR